MPYIRLLFFSHFLAAGLFAEALDKWKIEAGGMFVTNFETDVRISKKGFPVGAVVNTKDQLGLNSETVTYRADGYCRFTDHIGAGIGFDSTVLTVSMDNGKSAIDIENTLAGALVYLSYI